MQHIVGFLEPSFVNVWWNQNCKDIRLSDRLFFSDDKESVVSVLFRSVNRAVVWLEHMWLNEQSGRDSGLSHCDHTCFAFSIPHVGHVRAYVSRFPI